MEGGALRFVDVASESGLSTFRHVNGSEDRFWYPEQMGAGGGFIDYDNDGWQDIALVGGGPLSANGPDTVVAVRLYQNQGDGTFAEVTDQVGLSGYRAYGTGIAAADYDNDGDQDLFLAAFGENLLFRNEAGGASGEHQFVEVGQASGVATPVAWGSSALFFDADLDGNLDLFVGGYTKWSLQTDQDCFRDNGRPDYCPPATYPGDESYYYRNNGDGTFTEMTREAGFGATNGKSLAVAEWDFNQDGWSDVVVVNDGEPDLLYINRGDGTFVEEGLTRGIAYGEHGEARAGMGVDIGIVDSTGYPSIFVGNFSSEMISVYRQTRNGWFTDRAAISGVGRHSLSTLAFGVLLFDAEMDRDLDLFVANGHVYLDPIDGASYRQPPHLFVNEGNGRFLDEAPDVGGPLEHPMVARAVAKADYDRDGDLDILLTENNGPVHLLRNDSKRGNVVRFRLSGTSGNRDAIGAHLVAYVDGNPQVQRVRTGSGYLSQSETVITYGLGSAVQVDSLLVTWPGGAQETLYDLKAEQEYHLVEGAAVQQVLQLPITNPPTP